MFSPAQVHALTRLRPVGLGEFKDPQIRIGAISLIRGGAGEIQAGSHRVVPVRRPRITAPAFKAVYGWMPKEECRAANRFEQPDERADSIPVDLLPERVSGTVYDEQPNFLSDNVRGHRRLQGRCKTVAAARPSCVPGSMIR